MDKKFVGFELQTERMPYQIRRFFGKPIDREEAMNYAKIYACYPYCGYMSLYLIPENATLL